jgi:hypothetical protein
LLLPCGTQSDNSGSRVAIESIIVPVVVKSAIDSVKGALRTVRKTLGKRKHEQLTSAAIAELLKEIPDIDAAEAKVLAAEATGVQPDMQLLRARSMLSSARRYVARKRFSPATRAKLSRAARARWSRVRKKATPRRRPSRSRGKSKRKL